LILRHIEINEEFLDVLDINPEELSTEILK